MTEYTKQIDSNIVSKCSGSLKNDQITYVVSYTHTHRHTQISPPDGDRKNVLPNTLLLLMSTSRGQKLGTLLGCLTTDPVALEACMQQADASIVLMMQFAVLLELGIMTFPFAPVIDGVFLPDNLEVCFF